MARSDLDVDSEPLSADDFADALEVAIDDLREQSDLMTVDAWHEWLQRKVRYELDL